MTKKIGIYTFLLAILPFSAQAQEAAQPAQAPAPEQETTQIQINQPFISKSLGKLTLPFMWEPVEDEKKKHISVTETHAAAPSVLTIDLISLPKGLENQSIASEIAQSVAEVLGTKATLKSKTQKTECGKKSCPSVTIYTTEFEGVENGTERRCALQIVPTGGSALVLSICAESSRRYSMSLPEIVQNVFSMME